MDILLVIIIVIVAFYPSSAKKKKKKLAESKINSQDDRQDLQTAAKQAVTQMQTAAQKQMKQSRATAAQKQMKQSQATAAQKQNMQSQAAREQKKAEQWQASSQEKPAQAAKKKERLQFEKKTQSKAATARAAYATDKPADDVYATDSILDRANENIAKQEIEQQHRADLYLEQNPEGENLIKEIEDIMVCGYQVKLSSNRDFIAEGVDFLNRIQS